MNSLDIYIYSFTRNVLDFLSKYYLARHIQQTTNSETTNTDHSIKNRQQINKENKKLLFKFVKECFSTCWIRWERYTKSEVLKNFREIVCIKKSVQLLNNFEPIVQQKQQHITLQVMGGPFFCSRCVTMCISVAIGHLCCNYSINTMKFKHLHSRVCRS